jgi:hypothetical protein
MMMETTNTEQLSLTELEWEFDHAVSSFKYARAKVRNSAGDLDGSEISIARHNYYLEQYNLHRENVAQWSERLARAQVEHETYDGV